MPTSSAPVATGHGRRWERPIIRILEPWRLSEAARAVAHVYVSRLRYRKLSGRMGRTTRLGGDDVLCCPHSVRLRAGHRDGGEFSRHHLTSY